MACAGPTIEDSAQQYPRGTNKSGVREPDVVRPPTIQAASPIEGGFFKPTSGRFEWERPSAATVPAEAAQRKAEQQRTAAVTAAASKVPYEATTKEKTPGPGGGT
ncbi:hypothetical protein NDU88_007230 [Pleurodeles waltl]|uniref:Uncharacterized protein n=1 Tax=Pleurodeles waltl TaxID=8319 RepID=A0AAV7LU85_PLEWA|nr:hypothetical protein NDU88_007230 [Pleurodeles waltl]